MHIYCSDIYWLCRGLVTLRSRVAMCVCWGVNVLVSAPGFHVLDTDAPENPLSGCFWWARMEGCGSHGYWRWRRKTDSLTKIVLRVVSVTSVQFNELCFWNYTALLFELYCTILTYSRRRVGRASSSSSPHCDLLTLTSLCEETKMIRDLPLSMCRRRRGLCSWSCLKIKTCSPARNWTGWGHWRKNRSDKEKGFNEHVSRSAASGQTIRALEQLSKCRSQCQQDTSKMRQSAEVVCEYTWLTAPFRLLMWQQHP